MNRIIKDETGKKYGRLTVMGYSHHNHNHIAYWNCLCDCGKNHKVSGIWLRNGSITNCGCRRNYKHGMHKSPEYTAWQHMKDRCINPKSQMWYAYGARGIKVCERWLESFENFYADMGDRPSSKYSLDRIDNDGNYEPGNCRWATIKVQSNNTRRNRPITALGVTRNLTEWSEVTGLNLETIRYRLAHGWTPDRTMSTPLNIKGTRKTNPLRS